MGDVYAAVRSFDLHVPASQSLKTKRKAIRPITDGLRQKFRVSVAEVGYHEQWQRAMIGVAVVAESMGRLDDVLAKCERFVFAAPDVEVLAVDTGYLDLDDQGEGA